MFIYQRGKKKKRVILATPCSWKFGKPCLASKASRGFFLLLPSTCQKRGLAKEPGILMGLEHIQERKGNIACQIYIFFQCSFWHICVNTRDVQEPPGHPDSSLSWYVLPPVQLMGTLVSAPARTQRGYQRTFPEWEWQLGPSGGPAPG